MIGSYGWSTRVVEQIAGLTSNLKVELLDPVLCEGFPRDDDFKALDELAAAIAERHREHGLVGLGSPALHRNRVAGLLNHRSCLVVEIHLYGKLRRHAPISRASGKSVIRMEPRSEETVRTALERIGIAPDEVYHIFLNGSILSTQNSMAPWLRYQEAQGEGLDTPVQDSDRLGLFAEDMALLVV